MPLALQKVLVCFLGLLTSNVHANEFSGKHRALRGSGETFQLAKRLIPAPDIERRATFYGGWSLAASPCPEGMVDYGGDCCPKGTFGHHVYNGGLPKGVACCPDEKSSCGETVKSMPICADTAWYLWVNSGQNPFCCHKGEIGIWTSGGIWGANSACSPGDINVPKSILASSMILTTESTTYTGSQATATGANSAATTGASSAATTTGSNQAAASDGSTSSGSTPSSPASNTNNNSSSSSSVLSTPIVIGIVVVVVILLALVLAFWAVLKKRRVKSDHSSQGGAIPPSYVGPAPATTQVHPEPKPFQQYYPQVQEVDGASMTGTPKPVQVYYPPVAEADGVSAPGTPRPTQNQAYYPPAQEVHGTSITPNGSYRGELAG